MLIIQCTPGTVYCISIALYYCNIIDIVTGIVSSLLLLFVVCNFNFIYVKGFDNFVMELKCQYKHLITSSPLTYVHSFKISIKYVIGLEKSL